MKTPFILFSLLIYLLSGSSGFSQSPDQKLAGRWQGAGKIIVTWCQQDSLPVTLTIRPDGKVSGTIGDATIREGEIKPNSWFLRLLGNPDYVIYCKLEGALIAREQIRREAIKLLVDYKAGKLVGGFHSSGLKFGGKEKMMLSGSDLVLRKY